MIRFTKYPGLCAEVFRSYLADYPWLMASEVASSKCEITEGELLLALKRVGTGKYSGLDVLPYELYITIDTP